MNNQEISRLLDDWARNPQDKRNTLLEALKLRSHKRLNKPMEIAVIDALFDAGKSGYIFFANQSWATTKTVIRNHLATKP